ncbi:hypothetical protein M1373_03910 [Candidatus Marsarchaeota archaeon]|nr:hypothetical protein [Candidatus Marsarchaeota archaeon]
MIKKRNASYRAIFSIIIAAITFAVIYFDYYASYIGIVAQLALAALVLVASGLAIRTSMGFKGGYGVYMLSGKHGISQVDAIAKSSPDFWNALAMWGMVLGFGLLSYPLLRGRGGKKIFAVGIISIFLIIIFVLPFLSYALIFISLPRFDLLSNSAFSTSLPTPGMLLGNFVSGGIYEYALRAIIIVTGFSGYIVILLLANCHIAPGQCRPCCKLADKVNIHKLACTAAFADARGCPSHTRHRSAACERHTLACNNIDNTRIFTRHTCKEFQG